MAFLGRILDIDLTAGAWKFYPCPDQLTYKYLGGRGINVKCIYDNIPPGTDPFSPKNILTLSCGLLTGSAAPTSSRIHINALSPQTGLLGSSNVGGGFGPQLRTCGIQQLENKYPAQFAPES